MSEHAEHLLAAILEELKNQTQTIQELRESNLALIEAIAEQDDDPDAPPTHYMDGTPVNI